MPGCFYTCRTRVRRGVLSETWNICRCTGTDSSRHNTGLFLRSPRSFGVDARTGFRARARISQGKCGLDLTLSTARAHPPPLPNLSPSTSRSSLYFHTHMSVYKLWWHGRRPYTARILYISLLNRWQEAAGTYSVTTTPSRWTSPGFYNRSRRHRTVNYTNLHVASGYLLLRHYHQPVEPTLQRHPSLQSGQSLTWPTIRLPFQIFHRHYWEAVEPEAMGINYTMLLRLCYVFHTHTQIFSILDTSASTTLTGICIACISSA